MGAEHVGAGAPTDAVGGAVPRWMVRPGNVAQVQEVVTEAARARVALAATGLGAHLELGAAPQRVDVLIRMDRLCRVLDHQVGDMTVTVEAGCPLSVLEDALARGGQWLPLDPPPLERTTVGGLIATNLAGPLRSSQGLVRDFLLGVKVVHADGALVSGGGRVVKNVAGYDLPKLHIGALGTLGVIVEASFKVCPRPAYEEAILIQGLSVEEASALGFSVLDSAAAPLWLEILGPEELTLAIGLGGVHEEIEAARARIAELAARHRTTWRATGDGERARRELVARVASGVAALRMGVLPADVPAGLARLHQLAKENEMILRYTATLAAGSVRIGILGRGRVDALVDGLRPWAAARGGVVVLERGHPAECDPWGRITSGLALMRGVKLAFDPHGVFAAGRFVGGL